MKAAPFTFHRAESAEHALHLLAQHGDECKPIAGGQSLVPMMALRLARPAVLLDINRLEALQARELDGARLRLGATFRQWRLMADMAALAAVPLLAEALRWVGHVQTRNRGTIGGSLVHADPVAELPLAAAVLDAALVLHGPRGERRVPAGDFFHAPFVTATQPDELLVASEWPVWTGGTTRAAFEEVAIRHGDFAMASAACQIKLAPDGTVARAALGLGGVGLTPLVFPALGAALQGRRLDAKLAWEVASQAAASSDPGSDMHADAAYRRHLATALLRRALCRAAGQTEAMVA